MQTMPGLGTRPGASLYFQVFTLTGRVVVFVGFWEVGLDPESGRVVGLF